MRRSEDDYVHDIRALFAAEKGGAARRLAAVFLRRYPLSPRARYYFAVALSEITAGLSSQKIARNKRRTVVLLRGLLRKRSLLPPSLTDAVENEYYWFSEQPKKQYELGLRGIRKKLPGAVYSCGVGATMLALKAGRAGDEVGRKSWAQRSLAAWRAYHREFDERFGSVLYEAIAWGAAGDAIMMEKRLRRGASLAQVPSGNHSLRWARRIVAQAVGTTSS